jgi:hypothetical protein
MEPEEQLYRFLQHSVLLLGIRFANCARAGGRETAFRLQAILTAQPFREWTRTDPNLRAPEHRTKEVNFRGKVSRGMPARLAHYDDLPLAGPEKSPFRGKIFHLDQFGWTQVVTPMAHPRARIFAKRFRGVF